MAAKKTQKKPQKSSSKNKVKEPRHITIETGPPDPEKLKPGFVGRVKSNLPVGFKTADKLTKVDELEFECARLRNHFITYMDMIEYKGKQYYFVIDPLNQKIIEFSDEPLG